jgi:hypothetical protein
MNVLKLKLQEAPSPTNKRDLKGLQQNVNADVTVNTDGSCEINIKLLFDRTAEAEILPVPEGGAGLPLNESVAYIQLEEGAQTIGLINTVRRIIFDTMISNTELRLDFKLKGKQRGLGDGKLTNKQGTLTEIP